MERSLRSVVVAAIVLSALLAIAAVTLQSFGTTRLRILLSIVGLGVGAAIALVDIGALGRAKQLALAALGALAVSQVCYHLLVWTGWTTEAMLWRLWWISFVAAAASALVLELRQSAASFYSSGLALLLIGLALFPEFPHSPGTLYQILLAIFGAATVVACIVTWRRRVADSASAARPAKGTRFAWLALSHTALLLVGWYLGRMALPSPTLFDNVPSALASLSPDELETQLAVDLDRLKVIVTGIDQLEADYRSLDTELRQKQIEDNRDYYLPEEEDRIRALFMTYLSYRSALLRMVATYVGFEVVDDADARARAFMLGYASAMTTFKSSLQLVLAHRDEVARHKLNEAEREWGIPAGMFDRIYEGVTNERNTELAMEMAAYFELERKDWRDAGVWPAADFDFLEGRILDGEHFVQKNGIAGRRARLELLMDRVQQSAYTPMYAAQSMVAEWIGDTRVAAQQPLITHEHIDSIEAKLEPGDILLERRNWYLSNAFLPGFWPHAALYVGTIDDLRELGIADDPDLEPFLEDYLAKASDGGDHTVIESVSEGVIFNSLAHSMHADYVAVLRPRLSREEIGRAIARAFVHHGKPYDFEFDFFTSDKLVCTELVYRAYEGMLEFDLVKVMGRDTLPALELVHKYNRERGRPDQELDFVLFLDAPEPAGENEFMASAERPSAFNK